MFPVYQLVDALPALVVGFVALWAASSTRHWFVRTSVVVAGLLCLLLIPAYDLLVTFGAEVLVVVAGLSTWRRRRLRQATSSNGESAAPSWPRASLQTLMLLTILVAVALAVAASFPALNWLQWSTSIGDGVIAGSVVLLCTWLIHGKTRRRTRFAAAFVLGGVIALGATLVEVGGYAGHYWLAGSTNIADWLVEPETSAWMGDLIEYQFGVLAIAMPVLCAFLYLVARVSWYTPFSAPALQTTESDRAGHHVVWPRLAVIAISVAVTWLPLYLFWRLLTPPFLPEETTTLGPANYSHLNAAGQMISAESSDRLLYYFRLTDEELVKELEANSAALDRMRQAYSKSASTDGTVELDDEVVGGLMFVLLARSELADRQQSPAMQAEASIDMLRLLDCFNEKTDAIYSLAAGGSARTLWRCRSTLSEKLLRDAIETLVNFDATGASWESIVERRRIQDKNSGWEIHLRIILEEWTDFDRYADLKYDYLDAKTQRRVVMTELAILLYQSEHGQPPDDLGLLVPEFLPSLPDDPFGEGPLQYLITDGTHILYSVGPNGKDDGGRKLSDDRKTGDLSVEELIPESKATQSPAGAGNVGSKSE